MINSMTGFGRATGNVGTRFSVTVTAKSVNHRYLETSVRLPEFLWELEPNVRAIASSVFSRGKLDVTIRTQRISEPELTVRVDERIAQIVVPKLNALVAEFGLHRMTAGDLLRVPDLIHVEAIDGELEDAEKEQFAEIVRAAFAKLAAMRKLEGKALEDDVAARLASIRALRDSLVGKRDGIIAELLQGYRDRVQEIASKAGAAIDADRLAQETVLMVERGDVAEELARMSSHLDQFDSLIRGKEPAGKKLDFMCQEMLREINTLGSKSRSSEIRNIVVELKAELERIREQVQNAE